MNSDHFGIGTSTSRIALSASKVLVLHFVSVQIDSKTITTTYRRTIFGWTGINLNTFMGVKNDSSDLWSVYIMSINLLLTVSKIWRQRANAISKWEKLSYVTWSWFTLKTSNFVESIKRFQVYEYVKFYMIPGSQVNCYQN